MSPTFYSIVHLISVLLLTGLTFQAFSAAPERRRFFLMWSGIASFFALVAGFGLLSKLYSNTFHLWVIVKLVCWLGLSAMAGLAFRRRASVGLWAALTIAFVSVAVLMVYLKPGM